jgi:hypothetical protein
MIDGLQKVLPPAKAVQIVLTKAGTIQRLIRFSPE